MLNIFSIHNNNVHHNVSVFALKWPKKGIHYSCGLLKNTQQEVRDKKEVTQAVLLQNMTIRGIAITVFNLWPKVH